MKRQLFICLLSIVLASSAFTQFHVVPPEYAGTPGTGTFLGPLATAQRTYQLLIHESLLTNLVGQEITALSWRLPTSATASWPTSDVTFSNYDIYLSGSVTPANRSLTFSQNIVGPQTQVRSGSLTIATDSYPWGGSPNGWGPEITFNPWLYTGGHLLVEIRHMGFSGTSRSVDAILTSTAGYGTLFSGCWTGSYTGTSGSQGNFSVVRFTASPSGPVPPPAPQLISPPNGAANQPVALTLRWNSAPTATSYRVQLATDSAFTNLVLDDSTLTDTMRAATSLTLTNDTRYYWRVRARNAGGSGPYSGVYSFTTIVALPAQVNLISPAHGATVGADSVLCVWACSTPSATNYWFERATDSLFTTNRIMDSTLTDTSAVTRQMVTNTTYWWRVRAKNAAGWGPFSVARKFLVVITGVVVGTEMPTAYALEQNYPNPFNPTTQIRYALPRESSVRLVVYNLLGQQVAKLVDGRQSPGHHEAIWDGQNGEGGSIGNGLYFYRIEARPADGGDSFIDVKKMLLIK
jgi:hypothetical protein